MLSPLYRQSSFRKWRRISRISRDQPGHLPGAYGQPENGAMNPPPPDVVSTGSRPLAPRLASLRATGWRTARTMTRTVSVRLAAVVAAGLLIAVGLTGAVMVAVHYRGEAAALLRQQRTVSARTVPLPAFGTLRGAVTVLSVPAPGGKARIVLAVLLRGATPGHIYTLVGADCSDTGGYGGWAAGRADSSGSADLSGGAWTVSLADKYWLFLSSSSPVRFDGADGPGLLGGFTAAGRFSAAPAGPAACVNN